MSLEHWVHVFARVAPVVALHPAFGGRSVPRVFLPAIAVALASAIAFATGPCPSMRIDAASIGLQVLVGSGMGLVGVVIFGAIEAAGRLVDEARGAGTAQYYVPQLESFSSAMAQLEIYAALAVFWASGLHGHLIAALADSFQRMPLDSTRTLAMSAEQLSEMARVLVAGGVAIAGPAMAACLVADAVLGYVTRAAPQTHALALGLPLKLAVALGVTAIAVPYRVEHWTRLWSAELEWIRAMAGS